MFKIFKAQKKAFLPLYKAIADKISKGEVLTPDGSKFTKNTIYNYKSGSYRFSQYEAENGIIYLEDINPQWAEQFSVFLMKKGYCKNTIAVTLARLKAVLRRLYDQGVSKYNGNGIRASSELTTAVYSSIEDIRQLMEYDFSNTPGLERVRDIYVLQCFIGLRYSDLASILEEPKRFLRDIGGNLFFDIKTQKTGEVVVIPVAQVVKKILEKYGYTFGKCFSYQYYNKSIKEIGRLAGLNQEISCSRTEGGTRVDTVRLKWAMMSSHTARRTFATNAFLAGLPEKSIMVITGHKTHLAFNKYIRCSSLDNAIKLANHDFFHLDLPVIITLPPPNQPKLTDENSDDR